jgi:hypothetical protein
MKNIISSGAWGLYALIWLLALYIFVSVGINAIWMVSRWSPKDKIKTYREIHNPYLARFLVPKYAGYNEYFRTNVPFFFNRYEVNPTPGKISMLGVAACWVMIPVTVWYVAALTAYFVLATQGKHFNGVIPALVAVMVGNLTFYSISIWNRRQCKPCEVITKKEMRKRKKLERQAGKR